MPEILIPLSPALMGTLESLCPRDKTLEEFAAELVRDSIADSAESPIFNPSKPDRSEAA